MIKTSVTGKYTHMGTSILAAGRDDGINEYGLAVTMTSCGMPVVDLPYMKIALYRGTAILGLLLELFWKLP